MTRTLRFLSLSLLLARTERERTAVHGEMMALFPGHIFSPMRERNGWWDETACDNFALRVAVGGELWMEKVENEILHCN